MKATQNRRKSMLGEDECSIEPAESTDSSPTEDRTTQIGHYQNILGFNPNDISARSELASLLEQLGQPKQALCHWNMVLACDPNSLNGREGVARCRQRTEQPLRPAS